MAVASTEIAGAGWGGSASPSLEEVRVLAREHNLIPLRETFIDDCQTPVSAFLKLRGADPTDPAFLLESADQGRVGRYSFIGFRPRSVLRWSLGDPGDPYALAAAELGRFNVAPLPDLPPFAGGAVGMFAYDLVRTVEPLGEPNPDPIGVPDLALMLTDALVVFDHLKHTVTVLANVYADDGSRRVLPAGGRDDPRGPLEAGRPGTPRRQTPPAGPQGPTVSVEHASRAVRSDRRADHRVHLRRRRLPGGALATLVGAGRDRGVLDLPRAAGGQPEPVHVLPGLRRLRGRRRQPRAADHGHRPARLDAPDRGHPAARAEPPRRTTGSRRSCSPTPRSEPST